MVSAKTTSFRVQVGRTEGGNCSNVNSMRGNVPYSKFHSYRERKRKNKNLPWG